MTDDSSQVTPKFKHHAHKRTVPYIDKDELAAEVQKCIDNNRTTSDKLARMQLQIMEHLLSSKSFANYTDDWKDEMRSFAVYKLVKSIDTVDLSKCQNVFNYYTRVIALAFATAASKLKAESELRKELKKRADDAMKEYSI